MMSDEAERMQILDMIERGQITPDQGVKLLQALETADDFGEEAVESADVVVEAADAAFGSVNEMAGEPVRSTRVAAVSAVAQPVQEPEAQPWDTVDRQPGAMPPEAARWRSFWMIPLWIGVAVLALGGWLMYWVLQRAGMGFWFVLSALPFLFGLVVVILAWQSQNAPWVHLRITQAPGETPQRIAFSFPIPVRPTLWFLRTFGDKMPKAKEISLDKLILAVNQSASDGNPVYIQVDEGDEGEKVEIYIG